MPCSMHVYQCTMYNVIYVPSIMYTLVLVWGLDMGQIGLGVWIRSWLDCMGLVVVLALGLSLGLGVGWVKMWSGQGLG